MAEKSGLSKKDCEAALGALMDTVTDALKKGYKVQLVGFGSFEVKQRAARMGLNPRTQKPVQIPAVKVPVFKPGKALKDSIQ
ncbi:MAG: HU family DNA-binding protein [Oscillospiraceae bacterium]